MQVASTCGKKRDEISRAGPVALKQEAVGQRNAVLPCPGHRGGGVREVGNQERCFVLESGEAVTDCGHISGYAEHIPDRSR